MLARRFWILTLPLTATAAYLAARGVCELVGAVLETAPAGARAIETPPNPAAPPATAAMILARNPFDHVTGSLLARADLAADPSNAPACDGVQVLAIAAFDDPGGSFAAVRSAGKSIVRGCGGDVNGQRVRFVAQDRVWLEGSRGLCQAFLHPSASAAPEKAMPSGVREISSTEYELDRGVVDRLLADPTAAFGQARVAVAVESGRAIGVRIVALRADSIFGALGIRIGDVVKTINGFDISNPEKALEALARLRAAEHLTVALSRNGRDVGVDYEIR